MLDPTLHPEAPDLFPHLPETTAWLKMSGEFRRELYGNGVQTRKHALAVASLLGHSGPKVSMEHYIHCLDWLLPNFLSLSDLLKVAATRRVVISSARAKSTAYEWEQFSDPESVPAGRHPKSGIPAELYKQRFLRPVSSLMGCSPQRSCLEESRTSTDSWTIATWDLLYLQGTTKEPLFSVADRLGFDIPTAELVLDRAKKIHGIREERGQKCQRHVMESCVRLPDQELIVAYPKLPRPDAYKQVIKDFELSLAELASSDPQGTKRVLGYYVNNAWRTSNIIPFRDPDSPEDAVRYLGFLEDLGIGRNRIRFVSYGQGERSRSRSKWKQTLGLTWRRRDLIEVREPPYRDSSASARWFGIEPRYGNGDVGEDHREARGFRFLMVMAAIVFGYEGENSNDDNSPSTGHIG